MFTHKKKKYKKNKQKSLVRYCGTINNINNLIYNKILIITICF